MIGFSPSLMVEPFLCILKTVKM